MRTSTASLAALACATLCGCLAPVRTYCARRGRDLADCVKAEVGFGGPQMGGIYARVKATDFAVAGCGLTIATRWGWRGRYEPSGRRSAWEMGLPFLANGYDYQPIGPMPARRGLTSVSTRGPCFTTRTYDGAGPGPRGKIAERFWVGLSATLLLSARLDVNPAEFLDFLAGCLGWDMLRDDEWTLGRDAPGGDSGASPAPEEPPLRRAVLAGGMTWPPPAAPTPRPLHH